MLVVGLYLSIKRKVIKPHGTYEVDMSGLAVHDLLISRDPQSSVFGENLHNLQTHEIKTLNVNPPVTLNVLRL